MKAILILVFLLLLLDLQAHAQSELKSYKPKSSEQWQELNRFVLSQWDNQLSKADNLPHIFIGPFPDMSFIFYWDTYFTNVGLYTHNMETIAGWNTKNLLSVVDKHGFMGNAAMTNWGMNRSQPPYLSIMVRDFFEKTGEKDTAFLKMAFPILEREYHFWTDTSASAIEQHKTSIPGLQRFSHHASREELLTFYEEIAKRFSLAKDLGDDEKIRLSMPYIVEAATGMDFTNRFQNRAREFVAVELNTLLYVYETNFHWMTNLLGISGEPDWQAKAEKRKELMDFYCWDEKRGLYLDYDFVNKKRNKVAAITTFQPLWAGMASKQQAERVVENMHLFEGEWGLATTEKTGETKSYQWGETSVWAPMQMLTVLGLQNYGYEKEAKRIASKYLDLLSKNYISPVPVAFVWKGENKMREPGHIYEKYTTDGNINDHEYAARYMIGWSGGTAAFCYKFLFPDN